MKDSKLLFVCQCNVNRSPTFHKYVQENFPKLSVKSAGVWFTDSFHVPLTEELLDWADVVYVMDLEQEIFISEHFHSFLCKVKVIGISDQYDRDEPALIGLIKYWVENEKLGWAI